MLKNTFIFTKTIINGEELKKNFGNEFLFVSRRPYSDKKGVLPNGFQATLQVLKDSNDYGVDKNGNVRDNNLLETFEVTILDGTDGTQFSKGQKVKLGKFNSDASFAIGFDLIMRFDSMEAFKNDQ